MQYRFNGRYGGMIGGSWLERASICQRARILVADAGHCPGTSVICARPAFRRARDGGAFAAAE
jgi:hypothetical protein